MIATHNIKVNGRWVRAGEKYDASEAEKVQPETVKAEQKKEGPVDAQAETKKAEEKPKTTTRRKTTK